MTLPDLPQILLFLSATLLLNLTPGADVLYIASKSWSQGKVYGAIGAMGISSGLIIHVALAAVGMGEIFRYSPLAFWTLKVVGAGYLAYVGWKSFFTKESLFTSVGQNARGTASKVYIGGVNDPS